VASVRNIIYDAESYASGERTTSLDGQDYTISYPPIISPVLAAKCARRIRKNKKSLGTRRRSGLHLLRGLITCPCGWTWTVRNDRRWPNASTYRCQRRDHGKPQSENCPNAIPVRLLDPVVWGEVQALVLNPDRLHELIAERTTADTQAIDELEEELTRLDERLQSLDKERTWILDTAQAELLAPADLRTRLEQHQSKTDVIASQRQELAGRLSIVRGNLSAVDAASEVIGQEASRLAPLSVDLSQNAPWLAIPPEVAAVAPWELSSREGGLHVRRSAVARALGTKSNIEHMRHAQAAGRRELIEQFVTGVCVAKDDSPRGWTCEVQLVFHSSGALDMYSSDWCLK
jgi:hypothetical protein